jgi:hypothetical protein
MQDYMKVLKIAKSDKIGMCGYAHQTSFRKTDIISM